jgi:hypothetical protein
LQLDRIALGNDALLQRSYLRFSSQVFQHGNDPKIAQHFEQIQGAEFQFHALLDPLAGSGQGVVMPWQTPYGKK